MTPGRLRLMPRPPCSGCLESAPRERRVRGGRGEFVKALTLGLCLGLTVPAAAWAYVSEDLEKLLKTKSCRQCDLAGALLEGKDLSQATIFASNLTAATFDGANLTGAAIKRSDLSGTDFSDANLTNADLGQSRLTGAIMRDTDLTGADLSNARLNGVLAVDVIYCRTIMPSGHVRNPNCS